MLGYRRVKLQSIYDYECTEIHVKLSPVLCLDFIDQNIRQIKTSSNMKYVELIASMMKTEGEPSRLFVL